MFVIIHLYSLWWRVALMPGRILKNNRFCFPVSDLSDVLSVENALLYKTNLSESISIHFTHKLSLYRTYFTSTLFDLKLFVPCGSCEVLQVNLRYHEIH